MRLNKELSIYLVTVFLVVLNLLYLPADYVSPPTESTQIGDFKQSGSPEERINLGLVAFDKIGGKVQIRFGQLAVQIGGILLVAYLMLKAAQSEKLTEPPKQRAN